jgi:hypothetical protein
LGLVAFVLDWNHIYHSDFLMVAFLLLVCCLAIMVVTSFLFPERLKPEARAARVGELARTVASRSRGWIWQLSVGCRCCIGYVCWALPNVPMTK